jgi:hypothetical protein
VVAACDVLEYVGIMHLRRQLLTDLHTSSSLSARAGPAVAPAKAPWREGPIVLKVRPGHCWQQHPHATRCVHITHQHWVLPKLPLIPLKLRHKVGLESSSTGCFFHVFQQVFALNHCSLQ